MSRNHKDLIAAGAMLGMFYVGGFMTGVLVLLRLMR